MATWHKHNFQYDFLWSVEYDLRIIGHWGEFFDEANKERTRTMEAPSTCPLHVLRVQPSSFTLVLVLVKTTAIFWMPKTRGFTMA